MIERSPPGSRLVGARLVERARRCRAAHHAPQHGHGLRRAAAAGAERRPTGRSATRRCWRLRGGSQYSRLLRPWQTARRPRSRPSTTRSRSAASGSSSCVQRGAAARRRDWFQRVLDGEDG
ncbi:MAG: hypothetical protein U5K43_06650 [Halofilum sp. (in: g-proteobacteria)]|nr:hypothetical protein [Halofilum sp. (in: g-proteobacteria)]